MLTGTIERLNSAGSFGFIKTEEGQELFFHSSELQGLEFSSLREGQQVEFEVAESSDSSSAVRVRPIKPKGK